MSISVRCPNCSAVRLEAEELWLRLCPETQSKLYHFRCPFCDELISRDASSEISPQLRQSQLNCRSCGHVARSDQPMSILDLLYLHGVKLEVWHLPLELSEEHPIGLPITADELLDFHLQLQSANWFNELIQPS